MDINEFIKNQGIITVQNPNYNPKSKKNKEPKTLDIVDLGANNNQMVDIVKKDLLNQERADYDDIKKYEEAGLHWNPRDAANGSLDLQLVDAQSNMTKLGNALAQTIVSEIGLGTLLGVSDLFDAVGQAIGASDHNYQNPVSVKLEEWQEKFNNEVVPIYSKPGSGFGEGTDFGWWMQNIPSIASSLTLLIPAKAGTTVVSKLGKASREARAARATTKATKFAKGSKKAEKWARRAERLESNNILGLSSANAERLNLFKENAMTAAISRTMENYQEARQVYNDMYSDVKDSLDNMTDEEYQNFLNRNQNTVRDVDTSDKDEVAKAVAKKSSDLTFKADYANTVFDIIELYALRNIPFNGFRNSKVGTAARRLDKNARRFAGKYTTLAELDELVAKQSFGRKALDFVEDAGHYLGTQFYGQLSEGVEEAVNYIAQQEGMYLGQSMLGMEANTTFSNRLRQYTKNPELWESAFWGVMGGVVFQGAGSGLNRLQNAYEKKQELKKNKPNEKTGENVNAKTNWKAIWELPDVKRVKASIETRLALENKYQEDVKTIESGKNPYILDETTHKPIDIKSDEEKQILLQRAFNDRRTAMVLDAMDSGTIDMLRGYLEDENVKEALINKGLVTKEIADQAQQDDIAAIDKIQAQYDKNVRMLNTASKNITRKNGTTIPTEYLQIIARNNIESQLAVEDYERQLANWSKEAEDLKAELKDKYDPNINYKELIRLNWLTVKLGELEAEKREINKNKEIANSISGQERLRQIDNSIKNVRQMVADINPENKVANLLHAIENSFAFEKTARGFEFVGQNKNYTTFREAATKKDYDFFKKLDDRLVDIQERDFGAQTVVDDNMRRVLGKNSSTSINNISQELGTAYATLAALQYTIANERSNIKITEEEIEDEAKYLHNYMNELREHKIKDASEQIQGLADKYGANAIRKLVTQRYNNESLDYSDIKISDEDKAMLNEALDTIHLDEKLNSNIYSAIDTILANWDNIKAAQKVKQSIENGESSLKSENPISAGQGSQATNTSTQQQNVNSGQENGQNSQNAPQNVSQNAPKTGNQSGLDISNISAEQNITTEGNYTYKATDNPDQFEVKFIDASINNKHFSNEELFDQQKGVSIMDENFKIGKSPIIDRQGNVIEKGLLVLDNDDNNAEIAKEEEREANSSTPQPQQPILSTGVEEPAPIDKADRAAEVKYEEGDFISIFNEEALAELRTAKESNSEIDWNAFRERMITKLQEENALSDYLKERLEGIISWGKDVAARKGIKSVDAVVDAITKSSRLRETRTTEAENEFSKAVEELLKVFNDEIGCDVIDGKKYINVESLCRYCDRVLNNKVAAKNLLDELVYIVNKNNAIVSTDSDINKVKDNLLNPIPTTTQERVYLGIDYNTTLRKADDVDRKAISDVADKLQEGDKIDVERGDNALEFSVNGVKIGVLPYPRVANDGTRYQYNNGWRTDILSSNGNIYSKLRDLFIRWATDTNNKDIAELNDIIIQYAFRNKNTDVRQLIDKFKNNKEVKDALKNGFIQDNPAWNDVLYGISELWRFTRANAHPNAVSKDELLEAREGDINQWFERVANSFKFIEDIRNNPDAVVEVNSITEGKEIIVPRSEALPVSKAIGSDYKGKVRLGIVENSGVITIAGNGVAGTNDVDFYGSSKGNTFVIIPARNGNHAYIHAFPQRLVSDSLSKTAKEIKAAIYAEVDRLCSSIEFDTSKERAEALEHFLRKVLPNIVGSNIETSSCFFNQRKSDGALISINSNTKNGNHNGFTIAFRREGESVTSYLNVYNSGGINIRQSVNGSVTTTVPTMSIEEFSSYVKQLMDDCCAFNLSFNAISSDTQSLSGQRLTRRGKNGEFIVDIPGHEPFTFKSYNDFVLENDLVLATTKPTEDGKSNFNKITDDNRTSQQITVRLNEESSTPVERISDNVLAPTPKVNAITSVFSNKRVKHKGAKIAEMIFGKNVAKGLTFSGKFFNIFPENIIFVDENLVDNAIANPSDRPLTDPDHPGLIIPAHSVVVGKEWMDMATSENEEDRKEAVKKLIHEQLHMILSNASDEDIEQIRQIFDEFAAKNTNEALNQYLYKWDEDRYYTNGKINLEGLEEFLVETLTAKDLADALNNIESEVQDRTSSKKESLLQRLMKLIAKLIGVDIKQNSLYEKEFEVLRNVMSGNNQTQEITPAPVEETSALEDTGLDEFDSMFDDTFGVMKSSLRETKDNTPNIITFVNSFPIQEKAEIASKIENGEISISCK